MHQKSGHKWIASQHGGLRGHFALRVVQKLLEKLDIFCTSLRSVMKLRPEWSCLVKQLKKKTMTDCESWVFHHRFDNLNNLFSWIFWEINNLWSLVVTAIFFPFSASSVSLNHLTICLTTKSIFRRRVCVRASMGVFFYVFPRPLALCSIMCKAPHKPDQAETWGLFCILHFLSFFFLLSLFPLSLSKRKGRWDLMEVIMSENPACHPSLEHQPHHPHISITL